MCIICKAIKRQQLQQASYMADYVVEQVGFNPIKINKTISKVGFYRQHIN